MAVTLQAPPIFITPCLLVAEILVDPCFNLGHKPTCINKGGHYYYFRYFICIDFNSYMDSNYEVIEKEMKQQRYSSFSIAILSKHTR